MDAFLKECGAGNAERGTIDNASDSAHRVPQSALERLVDRLLASRAFAERWARHWLDLAGYADTIEIGRAIPAPNAWRYRDYVINAVHADKPYDQFIREQVAGDLMGGDSAGQVAERITATGFLALGPWELVNGDKVQLRMDVVDRQVNRIGLAMLGMTFSCARCHDHKFDPVSQADYHALAGIFRSTITLHGRLSGVFSAINETPLPETPAQLVERAKQFEAYEKRLADAKAQSQSL
ncbi:MAG: DUF1549 domain-containing protein, partial [Verrucomicrobiae bacterium]|nr:DUF1549 domain-containing protein [Verrucomicrobiae bacterium]